MSDDKPKFPWLRLAYSIASNIPAVKEAFKTTVNGIERDPTLLKFVESVQSVDQKDCLICLAHGIAKDKGLNLNPEPPEHWCPTRKNRELCGCGKPGVRDGQYGDRTPRRVCEEFPGCIPKQKASR